MQSELPTDNESSRERDFFTYEPSMCHIQSVIPYCYYYTSFCLYLLSICIGQLTLSPNPNIKKRVTTVISSKRILTIKNRTLVKTAKSFSEEVIRKLQSGWPVGHIS
jgi:hypothetical protein